jgi:hypothetical protein
MKKASVILIRLSLDKQLLAIQCSLTTIIVLEIESRRQWTIVIKASTDLDNVNRISSDGLIWSEHGGNSQDLIIVTTKGLELYKISASRAQCKLSRTISCSCYAFWYEPNHRLLLIASLSPQKRGSTSPTPPGTANSQSASQKLQMCGIFLRIDKKDHLMPKLELPPPEKSPKFEVSNISSKENVSLASIYGEPYCVSLQHINESDYLVLHHISKSNINRAYILSIPFPNPLLRITVIDNVLVCHGREEDGSVLFDVNPISMTTKKIPDFDDPDDTIDVILPLTPPTKINVEPSSAYDSSDASTSFMNNICFDNNLSSYANSRQHSNWQIFSPAWAWNSDNQSIWRLRLNIEAISSTIFDPKKALAFLLSRSQYFQAPRTSYLTEYDNEQSFLAKQLIFSIIKKALDNRLGLSWLESIFHTVITPYGSYQRNPPPITYRQTISMIDMEFDSDQSIMESKQARTSAKKPMTIAASLAAFGYGVVSGQLLLGGSLPSTTSTSSTPGASSKANDSSHASSQPQGILETLQIESGKLKSLEPMEVQASMQLFLPYIVSISAKNRLDSPTDVAILSNTIENTLPSRSINIRRSMEGELILSQIEMIKEIWLPFAVRYQDINELDRAQVKERDYVLWSLSSYLTALIAEGISPHPALSLLHLHLLASLHKYMQVSISVDK